MTLNWLPPPPPPPDQRLSIGKQREAKARFANKEAKRHTNLANMRRATKQSQQTRSPPLAPSRRERRVETISHSSVLLVLFAFSLQAVFACNPVYFEARHLNNIACRCNATNCSPEQPGDHFLDFDWPADDSALVRVVSGRSGARFRVDRLSVAQVQPEQGQPQTKLDTAIEHNNNNNDHHHRPTRIDRVVQLNINEHLQKVAGYGGALTDSAAMLINSKLDAPLREHAIESYFGARGLDYNLARVPIGGTDMSWRPYSCDDLPASDRSAAEDFELKHFRLQPEDLEFKLPLIRRINELRHREGRREPLKLMASSWSAPNWMKTGNNLVQGQLKGAPDGPYYDAYARYVIRFVDEYERELRNQSRALFPGGPRNVWALTPQNEPCTPGRLGQSIVNYNSVNFDPEQMAAYLGQHLIPNLLKSGRRPQDLALFVWDDTLLGLEPYKQQLFNDSRVYSFVRGLALHWYSQGLDKLPYKSLYEARRWLPAKFSLLSTEASFISRPQLGDWSRGVKYARDIIENLRAGAIGWIDWNLALNRAGGPTWSRNFLDAAMVVDEEARELYKNPMYFAIGHVSRFLRRESHIVASSVYEQQDDHDDDLKFKKLKSNGGGDGGWKMIDEDDEQTSELLVAAAENARQDGGGRRPEEKFWRQIGLVLLNRANAKLRTQVNLVNCKSSLGRRPLVVELEPESITSLAFNC